MTALAERHDQPGFDLGRLLQPAEGVERRPVGALLDVIKLNWARPRQLGDEAGRWLQAQPQLLSAALTTVGGAGQGAVIGYLLGSFSSASLQQNPQVMAQNPELSKQLMGLQTGGPWQQARNLAALTATQAGLGVILKTARGKDDIYGQMIAAFGGGAAFALSGNLTPGNPLQSAFTTGVAFAVFTGAFSKVGELFSGGGGDQSREYSLAYDVLASVGYPGYGKKLRRGLLDDRTLLLWNEGALRQTGIPPGPRLLILDHIDTYRSYYSSILKPGMPLRGSGHGGHGPRAPPPPPQPAH